MASMLNVCEICKKVFKTVFNCLKHKRVIHKLSTRSLLTNRNTSIKCHHAGCQDRDSSFLNLAEYRYRLDVVHSMQDVSHSSAHSFTSEQGTFILYDFAAFCFCSFITAMSLLYSI